MMILFSQGILILLYYYLALRAPLLKKKYRIGAVRTGDAEKRKKFQIENSTSTPKHIHVNMLQENFKIYRINSIR